LFESPLSSSFHINLKRWFGHTGPPSVICDLCTLLYPVLRAVT
jgi:hypothetical protein